MKILSIETSCDETGISILECAGTLKNPSFRVLANNLNSQTKIHSPYGGVYPSLAKREHIKNLPILLERSLKDAHLHQGFGGQAKLQKKSKPVDLIVVTSGPGLEPALWTGIVFAKELSKKWNIPIMPTNHMEGHILSVFGKNKGKFSLPKIKMPSVSLLVSGGHTELVVSEKMRDYKIIGETLDDAAGEAFDKVARMMQLPYPGGPEISKLAEKARKYLRKHVVLRTLGGSDGDGQRNFSAEKFRGEQNNMSSKSTEEAGKPSSQGVSRLTSRELQQFYSKKIAYLEKIGFPASLSLSLPRPMLKSPNFNFSFSGLKTAVLYLIRDLKEKNPKILDNEKIKMAIAMEFENAVVETLVYKTKKAVEKYKAKTIIIGGGVASNKFLRQEIKKTFKDKTVLFPDSNLSTDNSIMIGMAGYIKYLEKGKKIPKNPKIVAQGSLRL